MGRRIVALMHARIRPNRGVVKDRTYGPRWNEMGLYLASKWGIEINDTRAIMRDIFKYIEMEVLLGEKGGMHIPRFGRFERRTINHGQREGGRTSSTVIRFTRVGVKRGFSYIDFDDEEWTDE